MRYVRVAAGVLNQTPLDWDGNQRRIMAALKAAREDHVSILCLPELCITGYGCEDMFYASATHQQALRVLSEIEPETRGLIVSVGLPIYHQGGVFNAACLLVDGRVVGMTCKQNLAGDGIHYEPRWFKPWPSTVRAKLPWGDRTVPIGDLLYDVGGVRIGFEICEDAWVGGRPGARLAAAGVDVILNPSASHFAFDKHETRTRFVLEGSRAFQVCYIYANLVGNEAGRAIYDGDALVASSGSLVARGPRFSFHDARITAATVDLDLNRLARTSSSSYRPHLHEDGQPVIPVTWSWPDTRRDETENTINCPAWETSPHDKMEEFFRAESLALFDYMRKSASRGFVISLSGGADSAACTVLASMWVALALPEIGWDGLGRKLAYWKDVKTICDEAVRNASAQAAVEPGQDDEPPGTPHRPGSVSSTWAVLRDNPHVARLLEASVLTLYQSTANSGDVTRKAAQAVAEAVGTVHREFDVEAIVTGFHERVESALGRPLSWEADDLAMQNIQARVRSPGVWMLANIRGGLLLSTSNRSEASVGYATMDGDTSGGLSPIAGIDKAFLRTWLTWMQHEGPDGLGPLPALSAINDQQPTAELRPPAQKQTDEDDLMPYPVLDAIERLAIRDKMSPRESLHGLAIRFPQFEKEQLVRWTIRFFRLWCRNQWKRERYAPSFHLDDANLDPKTWCRFPILSGGFERELADLAAELDAE